MLRDMPKHKGGRPKKTNDVKSSVFNDAPETIADIGISLKESSRAQSIAALPDKEFEQTMNQAKTTGEKLTSSEMTKIGRTHQRKEKKMKILLTVKLADDDPNRHPHLEIIHGHCVTVISHPRWYTPSYEARQSLAVSDVKLIFVDPPITRRLLTAAITTTTLNPKYIARKPVTGLSVSIERLRPMVHSGS